MAEKEVDDSNQKSTIVVIIIVSLIIIGVVIAIPIVYVSGRDIGQPIDISLTNVSSDYVSNECTQPMTKFEVYRYLVDEEPFPYKFDSFIYRPSVISKEVNLIFGFRHDSRSWSIDEISVVDRTTGDDIILDGDFESNYLNKNYVRCILSNTRSSVGDILFDLPYQGDFYYNDQTNVGMTYITQTLQVTGGRYYNISYYLENRGYPNNIFILLVGS